MAGGKPKARKRKKDQPRRGVADLPTLPVLPEGAPPTPLTYACLGDNRRLQLIVEEFPAPLLAVIGRAVGGGTQLRIDYGELKPREQTEIFGNNRSRARTSSQVVALDLTRIPDDDVLRAIVWRETLRWAQLRLGPLHFRGWRTFLRDEAELMKVGDVLSTLMETLLDGDKIPLADDSVQQVMLALQLAFLDTDRERYLFDQKLVQPEEQWPILQDLVEHLASLRPGQRTGDFLDESWARLRERSPNAPQVVLTQFAPFILNYWIHVVQLRWARLAPLLWAHEKTGIVERFLTIEREVQQRSLGRYWDDELLERTFRDLAAAGGNSGLAWKAWHELARDTAKWVKRELGPEIGARSSRTLPKMTLGKGNRTQPPVDPEVGYLFLCEEAGLPRLNDALARLRSALRTARLGELKLTARALDSTLRERFLGDVARFVLSPQQWTAAFDLARLDDAEFSANLAFAALKLRRQELQTFFYYEGWTVPALQKALDEVGANLFDKIARALGLPEDFPLFPVDPQESIRQLSLFVRELIPALTEADIERSLLAFGLVTADEATARLAGITREIGAAGQSDRPAREIEKEIQRGQTRVEGVYAGTIRVVGPIFQVALRHFYELGALTRLGQGAAAIEQYRAVSLAQLRAAVGPYLDEAAFDASWRAMIVADRDLDAIARALVELALATARAVDRATPRKKLEPEPPQGGVRIFRIGEATQKPRGEPDRDAQGRPIYLHFCGLGDRKRLEAVMTHFPQGLEPLIAGGVVCASSVNDVPGIGDIFRQVGDRVFMVGEERAVYVDMERAPGDAVLRNLLWREAARLIQTRRGRPFMPDWSWVADQAACTRFLLPAAERLASMFGFRGEGPRLQSLPAISTRLQGSLWSFDLEVFLYAQKILDAGEQAEPIEDWHRQNVISEGETTKTLEVLSQMWDRTDPHSEVLKVNLAGGLFAIWVGICGSIWHRLLPLRWTGQADRLVEGALAIERERLARVWTRYLDGPAIDAALRTLDEARNDPEKIQAAFVALAARAGDWVNANW